MSGSRCSAWSKAFDRVQHQQLVHELANVGLRGTVLQWFADYLSRRSQQVIVNGEHGETVPCTRGVPQGSLLGPLLFCINFYIRKEPENLKHSMSQLYAGGIAFFIIGLDRSAMLQDLQDDLTALEVHLDRKGLVMNPDKTQFLILQRSRLPAVQLPRPLTCKGKALTPTSTAKYLGLLIDDLLTFQPQVQKLCNSVFAKDAAFRHGRRNLTNDANLD